MFLFHAKLSFVICLLVVVVCDSAWCQLRIATYNTTPSTSRFLKRVVQEIGEEAVNGIARPIDILAVQEQESQSTTTQEIVDLLNDLYGPDSYARGNLNGRGFVTQGIVYRTDSVELVSEARIGSTSANGAARQSLRYHFRPIGYENADFYLFNSHFKANNNPTDAARRGVEATALRRNADTLNRPVIFLGDYNLYSSGEPAYQALTAPGPAQAFDPIDMPGEWHQNSAFKKVHTQSTTVAGGENRAGGGVDDRFDFQLVSHHWMDGEGLSYIGPNIPNLSQPVTEPSYRVFGNDGSHQMGRNIGTGTAARRVVLSSLEAVSDHLPVVVDYQLPAKVGFQIDAPEKIIRDSRVNGLASVYNAAPTDSPLGADELDYLLELPNRVIADRVSPAEPAHSFEFPLTSDVAGRFEKVVRLSTSSPMVDEPNRDERIVYTVVDHANGSFSSDRDVNTIAIELGNIMLNSEKTFVFDIHNLADSQFTADLKIADFTTTDPNLISLDTVNLPLIRPGEKQSWIGAINTQSLQSFNTSVTIATADENIPGSRIGESLVVHLTGSIVDASIGDFDQDGQLSVTDIDQLTRAIRSEQHDDRFDVNGDGHVNDIDRTFWIEQIRRTFFGDANLDGEFNSADFVTVFQASEYEDDVVGNSTWSTGDWDGDGEFTTADFVVAFQSAGYEQGPRRLVVPEPGELFRFLLVTLLLAAPRVVSNPDLAERWLYVRSRIG